MVFKFNKLIPELSVSNFDKSLHFYTNIIGFKVEYTREERRFAFLSFQGSQLMIEDMKSANKQYITGKIERPFGRGINFQIEVKDLAPVIKRVKRYKYPIWQQVRVNWYRKDNTLLGNKEFLLKDPDGYLLRFFENIGSKPV